MPKAWSKKDERQYEHIKESAEESGKSTKKAEEIAARTVNKKRAEEGRTKNQKNKSKNLQSEDSNKLDNLTKYELYKKASKLEISGRSKMKKDELIKAIKKSK